MSRFVCLHQLTWRVHRVWQAGTEVGAGGGVGTTSRWDWQPGASVYAEDLESPGLWYTRRMWGFLACGVHGKSGDPRLVSCAGNLGRAQDWGECGRPGTGSLGPAVQCRSQAGARQEPAEGAGVGAGAGVDAAGGRLWPRRWPWPRVVRMKSPRGC